MLSETSALVETQGENIFVRDLKAKKYVQADKQ